MQQKFLPITKALAATFEHTLLIFDHFGYLRISLSSYITWACTDVKMTLINEGFAHTNIDKYVGKHHSYISRLKKYYSWNTVENFPRSVRFVSCVISWDVYVSRNPLNDHVVLTCNSLALTLHVSSESFSVAFSNDWLSEQISILSSGSLEMIHSNATAAAADTIWRTHY